MFENFFGFHFQLIPEDEKDVREYVPIYKKKWGIAFYCLILISIISFFYSLKIMNGFLMAFGTITFYVLLLTPYSGKSYTNSRHTRYRDMYKHLYSIGERRTVVVTDIKFKKMGRGSNDLVVFYTNIDGEEVKIGIALSSFKDKRFMDSSLGKTRVGDSINIFCNPNDHKDCIIDFGTNNGVKKISTSENKKEASKLGGSVVKDVPLAIRKYYEFTPFHFWSLFSSFLIAACIFGYFAFYEEWEEPILNLVFGFWSILSISLIVLKRKQDVEKRGSNNDT